MCYFDNFLTDFSFDPEAFQGWRERYKEHVTKILLKLLHNDFC